MKSYIKIVLFLVIVFFSLEGYSQRSKNDPTYSPNNYKHPNKAAIARNADTARVQDIQYVHAIVPTNKNYKAQNLTVTRESQKVQVVSVGDQKTGTRNYKQQFAPTTRKKK